MKTSPEGSKSKIRHPNFTPSRVILGAFSGSRSTGNLAFAADSRFVIIQQDYQFGYYACSGRVGHFLQTCGRRCHQASVPFAIASSRDQVFVMWERRHPFEYADVRNGGHITRPWLHPPGRRFLLLGQAAWLYELGHLHHTMCGQFRIILGDTAGTDLHFELMVSRSVVTTPPTPKLTAGCKCLDNDHPLFKRTGSISHRLYRSFVGSGQIDLDYPTS